jgi:hypothetical protein
MDENPLSGGILFTGDHKKIKQLANGKEHGHDPKAVTAERDAHHN